jgi:hypothetical protein
MLNGFGKGKFVQVFKIQLPAAFNASRLMVQLPAAFNASRLRVQLPAAFKSSIACGV